VDISSATPSSSLSRSFTNPTTGLLSFIGDPIGKGLEKTLNPVGSLIGGTGDRMAGFMKQDEQKKGSGGEGGYEKFGGKEQNGGNPLGL
jgi:hypothetical protein